MLGSKKRFKKKNSCLDCQIDTFKIREHYFLSTSLWLSIVPEGSGMLCIGCAERRLGRYLNAVDFTDCWLNDLAVGEKSIRFVERLKRK